MGLAAVSFSAIFLATKWGAGLSPDSVSYIDGGRKILQNRDLSALGSHWPPLYFILVATSGLFVDDILVSVRWLQMITFVVNVSLVAFIIYRNSEQSIRLALIGGLLIAFSPTIFRIHAVAWSEGSFCLFALLGLDVLSRFLQRPANYRTLVLSSVLVGLAFSSRYIGVTVILTGLIGILVYTPDWRKRIVDCSIFGLVSCSFTGLWMLRNWVAGAGAASRSFSYHSIAVGKLQAGLKVVCDWFFIPPEFSYLLLLLLVSIVFSYLYIAFVSGKNKEVRLCGLSFIFILVYIPSLLFSMSFFDASTKIDVRLLAPVYLFFVVGVVLLMHRWKKAHPLRRKSFSIACSISVLFIFFQSLQLKDTVSTYRKDGLGFASEQWIQSDTLKFVEGMPARFSIYTNGPDAIMVFMDRPAIMFPKMVDPVSGERNDQFPARMREMSKCLSSTDCRVVYFHAIKARWYLPNLEQIRQFLPLKTIYSGKDGVVLSLEP
jgi:4-amino-4-deoxy-L-arabinose transferase-like glycosyltransferase